MLFSSISFLYIFLPLMIILYYGTPLRYRNVTLLLGSLLFYFTGEPTYFWLLLLSTVIDYTHSRVIEKNRGSLKAKIALISSVCMNLLMLVFFKYSNFFITNINQWFSLTIPLLKVHLPIGISFFTFQTMSYTIDVYRGETKSQDKIHNLATYVSLFPQLIAGPIVRYNTIADELTNREHSLDLFGSGVRRFILGLAKKVLIANTIGELAVLADTSTTPSILLLWIGAFAFALQIYFDFSGYSDMAIGLGRIFGFHFPENFNYPYISTSISEFFRRWHISLGTWFKDYVYIPLGGNRHGNFKWLRNISIVWILTGIWHGASWNYLLWGVLLGGFIIAEKLFLNKLLEKLPRVLQHVYVLFVIIISFVIFSHENLSTMTTYLTNMFGGSNLPFSNIQTNYIFASYLPLLLIGALGSTPLIKWIMNIKWINLFRPILLVSLLYLVTSYLVDSTYNPFLYFRF